MRPRRREEENPERRNLTETGSNSEISPHFSAAGEASGKFEESGKNERERERGRKEEKKKDGLSRGTHHPPGPG